MLNASRLVPDAAAIHVYLRHLFARVEGAAVRGREALSLHVRPIVMTPETDGPRRAYRAAGVFNLSSAPPCRGRYGWVRKV